MSNDTLVKLSEILDTLINQQSSDKQRDSNSINALLTLVLISYENRKLDKNLVNENNNNDKNLLISNEINETIIVKKIFLALYSMFSRNPSLLIENNRYITIFKSTLPFFNCLNYSLELIDEISFLLIQIISNCFAKNLLIYNRLITKQRKFIFKYLDNLLSDIIKSFTNKNLQTNLLNSNNLNQNLISIETFSSINLIKISKISTIINLLKYLIHPSIFKLYFIQFNSSLILDSYISKSWFCLENIIINIKFNPENNYIISLLDNLYSTLLLLTIDYYYNDSSFQLNKLQLALNSCHFLLNWSLLSNFNTLQIILSQCLLKLTINLNNLNNLNYLWNIIGLTCNSKFYFSQLIEKISHNELKNTLKLLSNIKFNSDDLENLYEIEPFNSLELISLNESIKTLFFKKKSNLDNFLFYLSFDLIDSFDKDLSKYKINFTKLSKIDLINLINKLGLYCCYLSNNFDLSTQTCKICDSNYSISSYTTKNVDINRTKILPDTKIFEVYSLLILITEKNMINDNTDIIISLLIAFSKLFKSFRLPLFEGIIWDFIQFCFTNKIREIRLLSVKLFPLIIFTPDDYQLQQNLDTILSYLFSFTPNKSNYYIFEGYIMCLGELLIVKSIDSNYYIILNQLVNFMSDSDEFRSNMAIYELRLIASTKNVTPWRVVEPFIPIISRDIVKNRNSNPGTLTNFCAAIDMSLPLFLERTLSYTVPFLINSYQEDHITFIANTINGSKANLIKHERDEILAYLFATYDDISTSRIMNILSIYDPTYKNKDISDLFERAPRLLSYLFYHYNSEDETLKRIKKSLDTISQSLNLKNNDNDATQTMLNACMFGIVQSIATTLNDQKGYTPFTVKIRAIKSVVCLLKLCNKFEACLSQIITALQVALNSEELRTEALLCIEMIITTVSVTSVGFVCDSLLSQFLLQFNEYSEKNKILASEIIRSILIKVPNNSSSYHYSLKRLPNMKNIEFQHVSDRKFLVDLRIRLKSDNKWIIEQVLDDLTIFLDLNQVKIHQTLKDDELVLNPLLSIIEVLMGNSFKNKLYDTDSQISFKAAKTISLIGNLDLNGSVSSKQFIQNPYDNVTNFLFITDLFPNPNTEQELAKIEFSKHFLINILVRSYISSVNPNEQKTLAFAIQEFLSFCNFSSKIWDKFDDLTKFILEPLKLKRYKKTTNLRHLNYPIYKPTKEYSIWLRELTEQLLYIGTTLASKTGILSEQIESVCSTIPYLNISVSKFVLPYAVLFLVIYESNNSVYKTDLEEEFLIILNQGLDSITNDVIKETLKKCNVTIIEVLQFLKAFVNKLKEEEDSLKSSNRTASKNKRASINRIDSFINCFPTNILAKRCAECDMYEGSILFLETSYKSESIEKEDFFTTLKDMYVELEDYDQLHGVLKTFSTNSLNDKLLQFKYNEDIQVSNESLNAIAQYNFDDNSVMENNNNSTFNSKSSITELFEVLSKTCEYDQLLLNLKNYTIKSENSINPEWVLNGLQASIFTGDIIELTRWIDLSQESNVIAVPGSDLSIYYEIASGLMSLHKSYIPECISHIENAVKYIGLAISNSENIIHRKIPDYMVLLHSLYDFKLLAKMDDKNDNTIQHLKRRLQSSKKDFKSIWKIHSMKSSIYRLHQGKIFEELYKDSLVEGCQILRENGKLPQATKLITKALVLNGNNGSVEMTQASTLLMNVEFSKLFWAQNDYETALKNMNLVIENMNAKNPYYLDFYLTYLSWLDTSAEGSSDEIRGKYVSLIKDGNIEMSAQVYYQYAIYLNKLLEAQVLEEADGSLDFHVIKNYLCAVMYSNKYVHQILPKMVTLWLDYYQKYIVIDSSSNITRKIVDSRNNTYQKIMLSIEKSITKLGNKWYIVLSQIISRITHDDKKITEIISKIIIQLTEGYPWLLLYSIFAQARSVDNDRKKIGTKILAKLQDTRTQQKVGSTPISKIVASGLLLLESIMSVCNATHNYKHPKSGNLFKDLYKDLNFNYPRNLPCRALALPIKENMDLLYNLRNDVERRVIYYEKFHEKVKILFSLQQPKRIRVTGSNGMTYYLLFKPRDDLRKDNKVMEFSTVVNELLTNNYETQTRNMRIKSFAATPLNETTGIIEWVHDFITLRPIIDKQLKRNGITLNMRSMKAEFGEAREDDKLGIFETYLKKYPPVLGEWMIENTPNITQWYNFRYLFTRSLAVMSVVGYLIGVGDRHLDNIMLNKNTGMVMHIDFDCMFEKGKKLSVPEIVPFRLTPNLVEAMGVLKYEGSFRKSCELTMSLIRSNESILMNFLESFIHDPLMDWRNNSSEKYSEEHNQQRIKRNQERVYKILRRKICGILTKDDDNTGYRDSGGLSVSVSFQVDLLIQTAVSHENLSKMFFGWMPFL